MKLNINKLKKLRVGIVYLFGSEVRGNTLPLSDVDIGIVFTDISVLKDSLKIYDELYRLFTEVYPLKREIDIVFLQNSSLPLQFEAAFEGKVLYEVSPDFRADYTEKVLKDYLDFKPLLEELDKITLEAFGEENSPE